MSRVQGQDLGFSFKGLGFRVQGFLWLRVEAEVLGSRALDLVFGSSLREVGL